MSGKEVQNESAENPLTTKLCLIALQSAQENKVINLEQYGTNTNF